MASRMTSYGGGCLCQVFYMLATFFVIKQISLDRSHVGLDGLLSNMAGAIVCITIGALLNEFERKTGERSRTERARELYESSIEAAKKGQKVDAHLYLRPFELTDKLHIDQAKVLAPIFPSFFESSQREYEQLLAESLEQIAPLIALGKPGEHEGAGRIMSSESEWHDAVAILSRACRTIFVLPSHHAGTIWEITFLRDSGLLSKTVFLMPSSSFAKAFDLKGHWEQASIAISSRCGLKLPPYDPAGVWFRLREDGSLAARVKDDVIGLAATKEDREPAKPDQVGRQLDTVLGRTFDEPPPLPPPIKGTPRFSFYSLLGMVFVLICALSLMPPPMVILLGGSFVTILGIWAVRNLR